MSVYDWESEGVLDQVGDDVPVEEKSDLVLFTDEQIQILAEALRLANNVAADVNKTGVGLAVNYIEEALGHNNPGFDDTAFDDLVYTTTVVRPDDWEPQR